MEGAETAAMEARVALARITAALVHHRMLDDAKAASIANDDDETF